ncbi:hypothetical protein HZH68_005056 [Vespula germanica]|uniref:Uncharacterized protein n=1 Tax=Vespula germanica TaxID=30212 RepID=A0A834KGU1_VESGE|nr:hypothetical protein HZH68_005056 [Vespula germanica]
MALNGAPIIERYSYSSVYPSTIDFHQRSRGPKRMLPEKPSPASEMLPPTDEMLPLESTSNSLVEIKIYPRRSVILKGYTRVQQGSFARWLLNRGVNSKQSYPCMGSSLSIVFTLSSVQESSLNEAPPPLPSSPLPPPSPSPSPSSSIY